MTRQIPVVITSAAICRPPTTGAWGVIFGLIFFAAFLAIGVPWMRAIR